MDQGQVGFMNFAALLHFAQKGCVLLPTGNEEEAGGFAVKPADEGKKFFPVLIAQPVDQGVGAVRSGGMDEPTGGFIDDKERGVFQGDGGWGHSWMKITK